MSSGAWRSLVVMGRMLLAVLLVTLWASPAKARLPVPSEQWTRSAKLWLCRVQVAEADWASIVDHDAIAWILSRRWRAQIVLYPLTRFVDVVRAYSRGLGGRGEPSARQRYIRNLQGPEQPVGWRRGAGGADWARYRPKWRAILQRSESWAHGNVRDPTRGKAMHWAGMRIDRDRERAERAVAEGRWRRLNVPGSVNAYFAVVSRHATRKRPESVND